MCERVILLGQPQPRLAAAVCQRDPDRWPSRASLASNLIWITANERNVHNHCCCRCCCCCWNWKHTKGNRIGLNRHTSFRYFALSCLWSDQITPEWQQQQQQQRQCEKESQLLMCPRRRRRPWSASRRMEGSGSSLVALLLVALPVLFIIFGHRQANEQAILSSGSHLIAGERQRARRVPPARRHST